MEMQNTQSYTKRNKIFICVLSIVFVLLLIWCPLMYILEKAEVIAFEDLRNYKNPEKVYEEDEFLADLLNSIEQGKAELDNIYTNYLPLYNEVITYMQNFDRNSQANFVEFLEPAKSVQTNNLSSPDDVDLPAADSTDITDEDTITETEPPTEPPVQVEARLLLNDNFHRYYTFEPYQFLDRWVINTGDNLRKGFDHQVTNINKIIASDPNINFYVYVCTRMQDTEYAKELVVNEFSTLDFFNEFMESIEGATEIGWLDLDTIEKRVEKVFRTDHHWAGPGAYSGYVDCINMMKKHTPEIGEPTPLNGETGIIVFDDVQMRGSFAATLRFDDYYEPFSVLDITLPAFTNRNVHVDAYERYSTGKFDKGKFADHYSLYYNSSGQRKYTTKGNDTGRNLLIIGDSYSWWFNWLIAANFDNVHIYLPPWDNKNFRYNEFIENNNITDVLLMQFSDRLFFNYYSDSNFATFRLNQ